MDWSIGETLWVLFALFVEVMFIVIFIGAIADIFRRDDLSGGGKALWVAVLVLLPFLGTLIYVIARPSGSMMGSGRSIRSVEPPRLPLH